MYDVHVKFVTTRGVELGSLTFNPYIPHQEGDIIVHDSKTYAVKSMRQVTNIDNEKNTIVVGCLECSVDDASKKFGEASGLL